jgi:hypothetical protein
MPKTNVLASMHTSYAHQSNLLSYGIPAMLKLTFSTIKHSSNAQTGNFDPKTF